MAWVLVQLPLWLASVSWAVQAPVPTPTARGTARARPSLPAARNAASSHAVSTGGYRVLLQRISQSQSLALDFEQGEGRLTGRQTLWFTVAVDAPTRTEALGIEGFGSRLTAETSAGQSLSLLCYTGEPPAPPSGRRWYGYLMTPEVDGRLTSLVRLSGDLKVYARAQVVRLEFSLRGAVPQRHGTPEYQVELKSFRYSGSRLTAILVTRWPEGISVSRWAGETPYGISAYSTEGGGLPCEEASSQSLGTRAGWSAHQYRLSWATEQQRPTRIVVEALVRSGKARLLPFELRGIEFPAALPLPPEPGTAVGARSSLPEDFPLRAAAEGGALAASVIPGRPGIIGLGLSRWEGHGWSPWRWAYLATDDQGRAQAQPFIPGRYRVRRLWSPRSEGISQMWQGGAEDLLTVDVTVSAPAVLPPLAVPAQGEP